MRYMRTFQFSALCLVAVMGLPHQGIARPDADWLKLPMPGERVERDTYSGFAARGFDPVSYFMEGKARPGLPEYELSWGGAAWRFANEADRQAFTRDPEVYAPRFGGYDPVYMAEGSPVSGNPAFFLVRNQRLYLFRDASSRQRFQDDTLLQKKAEAGWGKVQPQLAAR